MRATKEYRLSMTEEAQKIVDQMTLEQKVWLMSGNIDITKISREQLEKITADMASDENHYNVVPYAAGGIEEFNLPPMLFVDGPRGVVCGNWQATCFPVSMARGATFSPELEEKVGHCIGKEVRAFGGNLFAGVCINMPYNPGWGRSQETYGEETYQIGQMGAALVRGVQDEDVMACVKHYAFNDMENARFKCSVTCDQRTEQEVYLPHFKDCVDAGAASIMSSYNRYNGVYCGHHNYLLRQVLKKEWDFDGFVMSDFCWGVRDTVEAANGGQDMEMMWTQYFGDRLVKAVQDGFVPEERVNEAALRIVRTILAFDKDHKEYDMSVVGCPEHIAMAKEVAEKGITLIKNENVLPLKRTETKKIALIGKLANTAVIGDHGSSWVRPPYAVTPEEGLKKANEDCEVVFNDGSDIESAKALAKEADAVIFVVGYNHDDEGEFISENEAENYIGSMGGDRKFSLGLHDDEIKLVKEVGPVNEKSTVVLIGGNMIMMTEWYDCVNSVIMAYYPGMEGGTAGIYYMTYVLGNPALLGTFSMAQMLPMVIGLAFTPMLVKKFKGMYKVNLYGYAVATVFRLGFVAAGYMKNVPLMLACSAIAGLCASPVTGDINALISAASDYTVRTKGKHIEGSMFSCSSLGIKVGGGIGSALSGWLLAAGGYVANAAEQSASTINMLNFMYLWFPLIAVALITVIMYFLKVEKANTDWDAAHKKNA